MSCLTLISILGPRGRTVISSRYDIVSLTRSPVKFVQISGTLLPRSGFFCPGFDRPPPADPDTPRCSGTPRTARRRSRDGAPPRAPSVAPGAPTRSPKTNCRPPRSGTGYTQPTQTRAPRVSSGKSVPPDTPRSPPRVSRRATGSDPFRIRATRSSTIVLASNSLTRSGPLPRDIGAVPRSMETAEGHLPTRFVSVGAAERSERPATTATPATALSGRDAVSARTRTPTPGPGRTRRGRRGRSFRGASRRSSSRACTCVRGRERP